MKLKINPFGESVLVFYPEENLYRLRDRKGKIHLEFGEANLFKFEPFFVALNFGGEIKLFNSKGKEIESNISDFKGYGKIAKVVKNGESFFLNQQGKRIELGFEPIEGNYPFVIVEKNGKRSIYDFASERFVCGWFDEISYDGLVASGGEIPFFAVKEGEREAIFTPQGIVGEWGKLWCFYSEELRSVSVDEFLRGRTGYFLLETERGEAVFNGEGENITGFHDEIVAFYPERGEFIAADKGKRKTFSFQTQKGRALPVKREKFKI